MKPGILCIAFLLAAGCIQPQRPGNDGYTGYYGPPPQAGGQPATLSSAPTPPPGDMGTVDDSRPTATNATSASPLSQEDYVKYSPGDSFLVPVKPGMGADVLGMGYSRDFVETGRVFPSESEPVAQVAFNSKFELVESEVMLQAYMKLFFVTARATYKTGNWYGRYSAYQLASIRKLIQSTQPQTSGELIATAVYYGWSASYVVSGDIRSFSPELEAKIGPLGLGLKSMFTDRKLKGDLALLGLVPKNPSAPQATVFSLADVNAAFNIAPDPVPIFVEYTVNKAFESPKPLWVRQPFTEGAYEIKSFDIKITPKNNGKRWDENSDYPEPEIILSVDGQPVAVCGWNTDAITRDCERYFWGRRLRLTPRSRIAIHVIDIDDEKAHTGDEIGTGEIRDLSRQYPSGPISFETTSNILRASITLAPVD